VVLLTVWTIAEPKQPWPTTKAEAADQFWTVEGDDEPYDARHWPDLLAALHFLVGNKLRMGDTLKMAGDNGIQYAVSIIKYGETICFDVGTTELATPEQLINWLNATLRPGDTVAYLHQ
jgi:hypothetical protein